jgi:hypothetical protein
MYYIIAFLEGAAIPEEAFICFPRDKKAENLVK